MLDSQIFNTIVSIFSASLDGAFATLWTYSLPLLSILGLMYLLLCLGQMILQSHSLSALGDFLWVALKIGVMVFFVLSFYNVFTAAFYTFLHWGLEGGGGGFGLEAFLNPSAIVDTGFKAAAPLYDTLHNISIVGKVLNPLTFYSLLIAYWLIVLAFGVMALHVIMTLLDFKLALASGTVLFPWAVLTQTAILGE